MGPRLMRGAASAFFIRLVLLLRAEDGGSRTYVLRLRLLVCSCAFAFARLLETFSFNFPFGIRLSSASSHFCISLRSFLAYLRMRSPCCAPRDALTRLIPSAA